MGPGLKTKGKHAVTTASRPGMRVAIVAVALVLGAGCLAGQRIGQTPGDVAGPSPWKAGVRHVAGSVVRIETSNTTRGAFQEVTLGSGRDDVRCNGLVVPASEPVAVGQRFERDLLMRQATFSATPGVFSMDLACPGPWMVAGVSSVVQTVSIVRGGVFVPMVPQPADGFGATFFRTHNEPVPLANLTLEYYEWEGTRIPRQDAQGWLEEMASLFVNVTLATSGPDGHPAALPSSWWKVDRFPLADASSQGRRMRFIDHGLPGMLDDGDEIRMRTGLLAEFQVEGLQVRGCRPESQACPGFTVWLQTPDGALAALPPPLAKVEGMETSNGTVSIRFGSAWGKVPWANAELEIAIDPEGGNPQREVYKGTPQGLRDADEDGFVTEGDLIVVGGLAPGEYHLSLRLAGLMTVDERVTI